MGGPINRSTSERVECSGTIPRHPACWMKLAALRTPQIHAAIVVVTPIFISSEQDKQTQLCDASSGLRYLHRWRSCLENSYEYQVLGLPTPRSVHLPSEDLSTCVHLAIDDA